MTEDNISFENKDKTSNNVAITDELGVDMIKGQLVSLYEERSAFEKGLDHAEKNLKNFTDQWAIDSRLYQLQLDNWGLKDEHKTHKIHDSEEYWELAKQQFFNSKVRPDTMSSEQMITGYNDEIETSTKRLTSIAEEILVIKKQLKDLGEELPEDPTIDKVE